MDGQGYKPQKDIARRIKILHLLFICVVTYFFVHIVVFIFLDKDLASAFKIERNRLIDTLKTASHRGNIYSRNGDLLATSITRTTVRIDFACDRFRKMGEEAYKKEAKILAQTLADCFEDGKEEEYYNKLIEYNKKFITYKKEPRLIKEKKWIFFTTERVDTVYTAEVNENQGTRSIQIFPDVDANQLEIIKKVPLLSRGQTYTTKPNEYRIFPYEHLARRTLGEVKDPQRGRSYGIEEAYNNVLAGRNGVQLIQKVASQLKIKVDSKVNVEAKNGYDVVTTLDVNVQDEADKALRKMLLEQEAEFGTAIVMECATGDILAMANLKRRGSTCEVGENYAIGKTLNPGSTFKLVSAMALLENGVPTTQKYHSGLGRYVPVGGSKTGAQIKDSHPLGRETNGELDMYTAFTESANVYFTKAVYEEFKNNPVEFSNFCSALYCDTIVGLGEMGARFKRYKPLDKKHQSRYNALVNMAYGYGFEITPLHTITIYNAVANKGRMVAPRLILRTERNGNTVEQMPVRVLKEKVCSDSTLTTLHSFLEGVSQKGTGKAYFSSKTCPFSSGSKTGTAQVEAQTIGKASGEYYVGSMVVYFPADNPRYTLMAAVVTRKPTHEEQMNGKTYYGANLAGPILRSVANYLYNRDLSNAKRIETDTKHSPTDIKGGKVEKVQSIANKYGTKLSSSALQGWCKSTASKNGNDVKVSQLGVVYHIVPDVVGMGLNDALFLLEKCGLSVKVTGQGRVVEQSVAPGTMIEKDEEKKITIKLK